MAKLTRDESDPRTHRAEITSRMQAALDRIAYHRSREDCGPGRRFAGVAASKWLYQVAQAELAAFDAAHPEVEEVNKERRARLDNCIGELQAIADEEQEYVDNMPENLAQSERAQVAEELIDRLESSIEDLSS